MAQAYRCPAVRIASNGSNDDNTRVTGAGDGWGSRKATKLAALSHNKAAIGWGRKVVLVDFTTKATKEEETRASLSPALPMSTQSSVVNNPSTNADGNNDNSDIGHKTDIQCVAHSQSGAKTGGTLATADSDGNFFLHSLDVNTTNEHNTESVSASTCMQLNLRDACTNSGKNTIPSSHWGCGWSGFVFNEAGSQPCSTGVATHASVLALCDWGTGNLRWTRSIRLWQPASDVNFLDQNVILVTEGRQITAWDLRIGDTCSSVNQSYNSKRRAGGCCVMRDTPLPGLLWSVASQDQEFATAGDDRMLCVYDPRTWRVRKKIHLSTTASVLSLFPRHSSIENTSSWYMGCCSSSINALTYKTNGIDAGTKYVDPDEEDQPKQRFRGDAGLRGDAPWSGIARFTDGEKDTMISFSRTGALYAVTNAQLMASS